MFFPGKETLDARQSLDGFRKYIIISKINIKQITQQNTCCLHFQNNLIIPKIINQNATLFRGLYYFSSKVIYYTKTNLLITSQQMITAFVKFQKGNDLTFVEKSWLSGLGQPAADIVIFFIVQNRGDSMR